MAAKYRLDGGGAWSLARGGNGERLFISAKPHLPGIRAAENRRGG